MKTENTNGWQEVRFFSYGVGFLYIFCILYYVDICISHYNGGNKKRKPGKRPYLILLHNKLDFCGACCCV